MASGGDVIGQASARLRRNGFRGAWPHPPGLQPDRIADRVADVFHSIIS